MQKNTKPSHYGYEINGVKFELKDIMIQAFSKEEYEIWCKLNIFKYISCETRKNGDEDLVKAYNYLKELLESKRLTGEGEVQAEKN